MIDKERKLYDYLKDLGRAAVTFSGGTDSTYLLYSACNAMGADNVLALTAAAECVPKSEVAEAIAFTKNLRVRHKITDCSQLDIPGFGDNPPDRCYICKKRLFSSMTEAAAEEGFITLLDGTNLSDASDYRPGMRALGELGIKSPLLECGFTKDDIRFYSKQHGLATWDMPSFACLASRFPYGERITLQKLGIVEKAEALLKWSGFRQYRMRIFEGPCGYTGSVEILPEQFGLYRELESDLTGKFLEIGFARVDLDPEGYRTGSLNTGSVDTGQL